MTYNEEDPNLEIFGTSPRVIAFFMILISLLVPIGIVPTYAYMLFGLPDDVSFAIYGLIWLWIPNVDAALAYTLMLYFIVYVWMTWPLTLVNYLYIVQIVRYYRGDCIRYSAVWIGLLSVTIPTIFAYITTGIVTPGGEFALVGPIPLQFIAGLIFMYKIPGPEMTSPWRGDLADRSWWKPKRPDWWYQMFPSSEDTNEETESKSDWLETGEAS
ncbi:MAG: hypothetical protein ACFFEV_04810 [Candidatus Thorarchaeota archaeon]